MCMNATKKFLCYILLAITAYTAEAQQVLSLDSCRALAMANNKELLISQEKILVSTLQRLLALILIQVRLVMLLVLAVRQ